MAVVPYAAPAFHVPDLVLGDLIYLDPTSGHQLGQRLALGSAGQKLVVGTNAPAWSSQGYPKRYIEGLDLSWTSATALAVAAGSCRSKDDAYDLVLGASSIDLTAQGALGVDSKTSAATATTHGTATFEPSASIVSELGTRSGTGTISTSTTTVTGTGTLFLSELALGDLIGNDTKGWSRVTAIASDTSCTIAAAPPGGAIGGGSSYTIIENATVWPGATSTDKRAIKTLSAAGTSVVVDAALTSNAAGVALKLGVVAPAVDSSHTRALFVWVVDASSTTVYASTQRTTPYSVSGHTTTGRQRVGSVLIDSSGNMIEFRHNRFGSRSDYWLHSASEYVVVSGGTATSFSARNCTLEGLAPPTADMLRIRADVDKTGSAGNFSTLTVRPTGATNGVTPCYSDDWQTGDGTTRANQTLLFPCNSAQQMDYKGSGTNFAVYMTFFGWSEVLP